MRYLFLANLVYFELAILSPPYGVRSPAGSDGPERPPLRRREGGKESVDDRRPRPFTNSTTGLSKTGSFSETDYDRRHDS